MAKKGKDEHGPEGHHHGGLAIGRATGIITSKADEDRKRAPSKDSAPAKAKDASAAKPRDSAAAKAKPSKSAKKQKGGASAGKSKSGKKR